jgi:ribosomal protein S18 acetylase RimI-like enzyme
MIRLATASDANQIAVVHVRGWQAAYRGHMPDAELDALEPARRALRWTQALVEPLVGVFVAVERDAIVGFSSFRPSLDRDAPPSTCEIGSLYVDPAHWRCGHGRALIDAVVGAARERAFEEVSLWVLGANAAARAFYEKVGFAPDGGTRTETLLGVSLDEVRYRRRLR